MKINSAYPFHLSATPLLAHNNIELNIIKNSSPYVLATNGDPDIVIHPLSKIINGEFPTIKFFGPACKFPNYEYNPVIGYTEFGKDVSPLDLNVDVVFINTINDIAFIKYLESLDLNLAIYGKPCGSIYYYGPQDFDSYELYNTNPKFIAVDNEPEALKAISYINGPTVLSNFKYMKCKCFRDSTDVLVEDLEKSLYDKRWENIFGVLLKCNLKVSNV